MVASGINPGCNTGRSVLHSGTVGAALTAANFGISGLAVSLGMAEPMPWETAARLAMVAMEWLVEAPVRTVLNLNVPAVAFEDLAGIRQARLAPFGTVRTAIAEQRDGRIELELRDTGEELDPDTDTALIAAGFATITPLVGIRADTDVEVAAAIEERLPSQ
jgi:5'-nucleotidase